MTAPGYGAGEYTSPDFPLTGGLVIRVVLTAFVFNGGRGTGIAIAASSGG